MADGGHHDPERTNQMRVLSAVDRDGRCLELRFSSDGRFKKGLDTVCPSHFKRPSLRRTRME